MISLLTRSALHALSHHKGRSLLTMLGIIIGIGGIIVTSAIGKGAQVKAREQLLAFGSKAMQISAGNFLARTPKSPKLFSREELQRIQEQIPLIQYLSPKIATHGEISYQAKTLAAEVEAFNADGFPISDLILHKGSLFNQNHVTRQEHVVVLPADTAKALFAWEDPLGKIIRINKIPFTVIGILAEPKIKSRWDIGQLDVYIPLSVGELYFNKELPNCFTRCNLSPFNEHDTDEIKRLTRRILRAAHNLSHDEPDDFMIWDLQSMAQAAEAGAKIIGLFALLAASIALLVGGIGIMNIMLVAVSERTKEIGIKMALGATKSLIRKQFLIEAIVLCLIGGSLGSLVGSGIAFFLSTFSGLPAIIELGPLLIALFITSLIGLCFGFYPAYKASNLNPIQALLDQ